MQKTILLLSGRIASGKSSVARLIAERFGYTILKTRTLLADAAPEMDNPTRALLQKLGRDLDLNTGGWWVYNGMRSALEKEPRGLIVDSVRIQKQIDVIRQHLRHQVTHIHLTAPQVVLTKRFTQRAKVAGDASPADSYAEANFDPTENQVEDLAHTADAVIDTSASSVDDVIVRIAACLGLQSRPDVRLVDVVVGGQFGSEGKGQICSYLGPEYDALVRVGGPNAGHTVFEDPKPYTFHHLPSATRASKAKLVIGPGATLSPSVLLREIAECGLGADRLVIDQPGRVKGFETGCLGN